MLGFMTNSTPSATNAVFNHLYPQWLFNKQAISTEKLTHSHAPHANFLRKWERRKEKILYYRVVFHNFYRVFFFFFLLHLNSERTHVPAIHFKTSHIVLMSKAL